MNRHGYLILCLMFFPLIASSQIVINNFDGAVSDSTINWSLLEGDPSTLDLWDDSTDAYEGAAAMRAAVYIGPFHDWGSYAQLGHEVPAGESPLDWSTSDSLSVWIKVHEAPNVPASFVFRMHIVDQPAPTDNTEEYIYENGDIVDASNGWLNLIIPLVERETDGTVTPNAEGFVRFPESWATVPFNNKTLDLDKIVRYSFVLVTSSAAEDIIELSFDDFTRNGDTAVKEDFAEVNDFQLFANYPNPFNPSTEIAFQIAKTGNVRLNVFNLMGQEVGVLVDGKLTAGTHHVQFNAGNLPSGVYFYRLETAGQVSTRKMILLP